MNKEQELIAVIKENPTHVKIRGNRQAIILSFEDIEIEFPVLTTIYTRFVCSLTQAKIIKKGPLEEVTPFFIAVLADAVVNRQYSSFDVVFK